MNGPPVAGHPRTRLSVLLIVVITLFGTLLVRLWYLQVIQAKVAGGQLATSGVVTVYTPAPRGEILDRNGRVLVGNRSNSVIEVDRQDAADAAMVDRLAALLDMSVRSLRAAIDNVQYASYQPVPVDFNASPAQVLYVNQHQAALPGVQASTVTQPYVTALGRYAGDVVGYVGQVDAQQLAALQKAYPQKHYQPGDLVGQYGIEAQMQNYLAGQPGVERIAVNAQTQQLSVVSSTPPVPGDNVVLTLDGALQKVADTSILQGEKVARTEVATNGTGHYKAPGGAAVAEDPRNGQVLAIATEPTFNPEQFDRGITTAEYRALADNPADPLENRAIQGQYAPGSTFKLVTATAGLADGVVTPSYIFNDTRGYIVVAGHVFHDDAGVGAGYINLTQALTVSSDNYFNVIGEKLWDGRATYGPLAMQKVASSYGLGAPTGIDLPGEQAGLVPTPAQQAALKRAQPNNPFALGYWIVGDSIEMAIGQFQDLVTPIQLTNAYSTFANGGTRYRPQLVLRVETPTGRVVKRYPPRPAGHSTPLSGADRQAMIQGYVGVTHNPKGTGYPVFGHSTLANEDIAGKTGTAQLSCTGCQDNSVFIGFGPASSPRYVVDAFVEDAGYGESIAAPIVRRIYDQIYGKPLQPVGPQAVAGG